MMVMIPEEKNEHRKTKLTKKKKKNHLNCFLCEQDRTYHFVVRYKESQTDI